MPPQSRDIAAKRRASEESTPEGSGKRKRTNLSCVQCEMLLSSFKTRWLTRSGTKRKQKVAVLGPEGRKYADVSSVIESILASIVSVRASLLVLTSC